MISAITHSTFCNLVFDTKNNASVITNGTTNANIAPQSNPILSIFMLIRAAEYNSSALKSFTIPYSKCILTLPDVQTFNKNVYS
ncbi:hypothetical protein D3C87_26940 [compost metagenome]